MITPPGSRQIEVPSALRMDNIDSQALPAKNVGRTDQTRGFANSAAQVRRSTQSRGAQFRWVTSAPTIWSSAPQPPTSHPNRHEDFDACSRPPTWLRPTYAITGTPRAN